MNETSDPLPPPVSAEHLSALAAYRALFEAEAYACGHWETPPGGFPFFVLNAQAEAFLALAAQSGFIFPFDWPAYAGAGGQPYLEQPDRLAEADLLTLRRLLTVHLRNERFCEGHLAWAFHTKQIDGLLRRLEQLVERPHTEP